VQRDSVMLSRHKTGHCHVKPRQGSLHFQPQRHRKIKDLNKKPVNRRSRPDRSLAGAIERVVADPADLLTNRKKKKKANPLNHREEGTRSCGTGNLLYRTNIVVTTTG